MIFFDQIPSLSFQVFDRLNKVGLKKDKKTLRNKNRSIYIKKKKRRIKFLRQYRDISLYVEEERERLSVVHVIVK